MSATASTRRAAPAPVETRTTPHATDAEPWLSVVAEKVRRMDYGTVQITVHDSKVVQVERTERTRFDISKLG